MDAVIEVLNESPLAGLLLVVTAGYLLGRPAWRGISLGPAGGTLFVGLLLGHLGLRLVPEAGDAGPRVAVGAFGFALFVYSVGFEAGPGFFAAFRSGRGWRMVLVGVAVNVLAIATAVGCGLALQLGPAATAGILAGSLTSAPTFAAVSEVLEDRAALSVAFALTYPFGLVGLVFLIQTVPRLVRQDLVADAEGSEDEAFRRRPRTKGEPEQTRAFQVTRDNVIGKALGELDLTHRTGCFVSRVHRGETFLIPDARTTLEQGDQVLATGRVDELRVFEQWVGPEVFDDELRSRLSTPRRIHVTRSAVVGRSLAELGLIQRFRCLVTSVERGGESLEPQAELVLERGDTVDVVGKRSALRAVAQELGRFEASTTETDIAVYAGGILLGLLLGRLRIELGGPTWSLGVAGGLLVSGLLLGNLRRVGPFNAHVPPAARQLVRDLGILLFVSEVAVPSGAQLAEQLAGPIWQVLAAGVVVTIVPVIGALAAARWALGMRPVDSWGSVAGGMTSSAALLAVKRAADSEEPAVAYATAYAVSSVLVTMAGHVVVLLLAGG